MPTTCTTCERQHEARRRAGRSRSHDLADQEQAPTPSRLSPCSSREQQAASVARWDATAWRNTIEKTISGVQRHYMKLGKVLRPAQPTNSNKLVMPTKFSRFSVVREGAVLNSDVFLFWKKKLWCCCNTKIAWLHYETRTMAQIRSSSTSRLCAGLTLLVCTFFVLKYLMFNFLLQFWSLILLKKSKL
jgi:hypothetical protein